MRDSRAASSSDMEGEQGLEPAPPSPAPDPFYSAVHRSMAESIVEFTAWAETHRTALKLGAAVTVAGSLAYLLHSGTVPGFRQFTSMASLPSKVRSGTSSRSIPVLVHSATVEGATVVLQIAHFPLIQRVACLYRRLPREIWLERAARKDHLMNCYLAGVLSPSPAGAQALRALCGDSVHALRVSGIVHREDQAWTRAGQNGGGQRVMGLLTGRAEVQAGDSSSEGAGPPKAALGADDFSSDEEAPELPTARAASGMDRDLDASAPASAATASRAGEEEFMASARDAHWRQMHRLSQRRRALMLWGDLWARPPKQGLAALWHWRREDVALNLVLQGHALCMEAIDLEWLGVSDDRSELLYRAEKAAAAARRGLWHVPPSRVVRAWSASVQRHARAAGAGVVGGVAAAGGGLVGSMQSAGGEIVESARAAGRALQKTLRGALLGSGKLLDAAESGLGRAESESGQANRSAAGATLHLTGKATGAMDAARSATRGAAGWLFRLGRNEGGKAGVVARANGDEEGSEEAGEEVKAGKANGGGS